MCLDEPLSVELIVYKSVILMFYVQGVMQDLRLTFGSYGYLSQCPQMDSQCPTCSDYTALKLSVASLQSQLQLLNDRVSFFSSSSIPLPMNLNLNCLNFSFPFRL